VLLLYLLFDQDAKIPEFTPGLFYASS